MKKLKEYLRELIGTELMAPLQAPLAAPVFFEEKPAGPLLLVIGYRPLSETTTEDDYPIPGIRDPINQLVCLANWVRRRSITEWQ